MLHIQLLVGHTLTNNAVGQHGLWALRFHDSSSASLICILQSGVKAGNTPQGWLI